MTREKLLGSFGEAAAAEYLRKKRYELLGMNYRCSLGEVDIIARQGTVFVFVEVKLRREGGYASALEAVTPSKQRKLRYAAEAWLAENGQENSECRFDVVEIYLSRADGKVTSIRHMEEAF